MPIYQRYQLACLQCRCRLDKGIGDCRIGNEFICPYCGSGLMSLEEVKKLRKRYEILATICRRLALISPKLSAKAESFFPSASYLQLLRDLELQEPIVLD